MSDLKSRSMAADTAGAQPSSEDAWAKPTKRAHTSTAYGATGAIVVCTTATMVPCSIGTAQSCLQHIDCHPDRRTSRHSHAGTKLDRDVAPPRNAAHDVCRRRRHAGADHS